ncbi:hypothetical protein O166_14185 [Pseudogulbenkiania ferrooxidans EGD-HP2]|uniref:Uncharacterized protein n=1 Tax=Pseudogulbenkiania ferrooxidans EGD-HP2 TaxID=1388764 RepID=A0ABP2XHV2_9NEIS|nr:hypothetical protein O166_14185 [Pseudogulbenkiania ferrooxidans EGD-HP2]
MAERATEGAAAIWRRAEWLAASVCLGDDSRAFRLDQKW